MGSRTIFFSLLFLFALSLNADVVDSFDEPREKPRDDRLQWIEKAKKKNDLSVKPALSELEQKTTAQNSAVTKKNYQVLSLRDAKLQKAKMDTFKQCKLRFWTKGALLDRKASFLNLPNPVRIEKCDLKLKANRAKLIYGKKKREIIRVEAFGNVRVEKKDSWTGLPMKARSSSLVYDNSNQKIAMLGNPASLKRGEAEEFESKRIEYDILEDVVRTEAAKGELGNP